MRSLVLFSLIPITLGCGDAGTSAAPDLSASAADLGTPTGGADLAATGTDGGGSDDDAGAGGARTITFENRCAFPIWVGALSNPVAPAVSCSRDDQCQPGQRCNPGNQLCTWTAPRDGGWALPAGAHDAVALPPSWGGRFWPRTGCADFNDRGVPACQTGDCGGHLACPLGVGGAPPATLAELTLIPPTQPVGLDFYDVSIVDGFNVPVSIAPVAGSFRATAPPGANATYYCGSPGATHAAGALAACAWTLDAAACPTELHDTVGGQYVGCLSANQVCARDPGNTTLACAQTRDLYGCVPGGPNAVSGSCYSTGASSTCCGCPSWSAPGACQGHNTAWQLPSLPERYAKVFKDACPTAYSFPYDDPTSTFTCQGTPTRDVSYTIVFCP